jgi:hypothetical protein
MASYPVEAEDTSGLVDAVNNLLSGPGGLGQDFSGFASFQQAYLTANFRTPYTMLAPFNSTTNVIPRIYVQAFNLSTSRMLDGNTFEFTFASLQAQPPFVVGQLIDISGLSSTYNGNYGPIGVASCSTTKCIARTRTTYAVVPPESGGAISLEFTSQGGPGGAGYDISTDCNSKVVVTGGTDRVFVAGQLLNTISYTASTPSDLYYTVKITRYIGSPNTNLVNPGFVFTPDETVASIQYEFLSLNGTGTLPLVNTVFSTLVDADIAPGYYWYILDVNFYNTTGNLQVTTCELAQRSFTAQVVKQ